MEQQLSQTNAVPSQQPPRPIDANQQQVVTPPQVQSVNQPTPQVNPSIADDVDVIEKEWVDKAKQIVAATHDDPRAQEYQVSELQSDYLKKRYGKEIGTSEQ